MNQVVLTDNAPALLASGVAAIRFDFNTTGLYWTWYREIDVIGTAIGDSTPPAIATFSPADNATNVTVGANLVATFNELIAIGTGNITIKNLTDNTQSTIAITSGSPQVTVAGSVLTINPSADLTGAKDYAIQIDAGAITDLTGNPFGGIADDTTWNFATDGTPPTIVTLSPADNATGVAVGANLVATFNETIAVGTGNITIRNLTDDTQSTIDITSGSPQVTVAGSVLTINPTADLLAGKSYAIRIDATAVKDASGNLFAGIANDTTWNFAVSTGVATATSEVANGSPHAGPLIQATVGDLLETARSSITDGGKAGGTIASVYDGQITTGTSTVAAQWGSTTPGAHYVEFNLNTTTAPQGYDISSIKVIQNGDGFRPRQAWKVAFKPVGSGSSFTDYFTLPATGNANQVNQVVLTDSVAALLASGVAAIRFDFNDTGGGFGWTWYREIDVIGSATSTSGYAAWAGGAAFGDDANGDGVKNGLAWLLGAASPNADALSLLPVPTVTAGGLKLNFNMLNAANRGTATLSVAHSSDLGIGDPWTAVLVPETSGGPTNGVTFTVTPGSPTNAVEAVISDSEAAAGKLFGRLSATGP